MIAITLLYTFLETILQLLLSGAVYIANAILDESITFFSADQDFFVTIMTVLPFGDKAPVIGQIIRGIAYGIVGILIILSLLKSIAAPISGGESENPLQVALKGAITIVLMVGLFGFKFGRATSGTTIQYSGLLSIIGKWFSLILSQLGDVTNNIQALGNQGFAGLLDGLDVTSYLASCVLYASILVTVFGAAVTYIERMLSFAAYILIGPIAVGLNACSETADTFKEWLTGILTQFLAIFISLIMWSAFINQICAAFGVSSIADSGEAARGGNQIFMLAIALALLNLMKDSEKILNAFGLRTMQQGRCASSLIAGAGALVSGAMLGMQASRAYNMAERTFSGGGAGGSGGSGIPEGIQSPFDSNGQISDKGGLLHNADGKFSAQNFRGLMHTMHPLQRMKNVKNQQQGIRGLMDKMASGDTISGSDVNAAMGWGEGSRYNAVGEFKAVEGQLHNGEYTRGLVGTIQDHNNGELRNIDNAYVPINDADNRNATYRQMFPDVHNTVNNLQPYTNSYNTPSEAGTNLDTPTKSETYAGTSYTNDPEDFF